MPAQWVADDITFDAPASLLITPPDHYVTRLMPVNGVGLAELGGGQGR